MSKKKKNQEEPWSRRFGEDENFNNRQYSRSARNSKKKEVAPLHKVFLFLFIALLVIPFATYYWSQQSKRNPEPQTAEQVMVKKQGISSTSESSSEEESSVSSESESSASGSPESSSESSSEESVESTTPELPPVVEEPESVEEDPENDNDGIYANTYTIKAGDNLYRIALNHGMTLDELKEANGLSGDSAEIGVVLKVK